MSRSEQFFHGTTHAITDKVLPADSAGKNVSEYSFGDPGDMSEGDHAFAIRNFEGYAWHAANTFHANGRRPRVYEVEPAADMKPGPWNKDHPNFLEHHEEDDPDNYHVSPDDDDYPHIQALRERVEDLRANHQDEWASPTGFKVKKRIDIMPGRQGTFPDINWTRFSTTNATTANHPDDTQVRYGTRHGGIPDSPQFNKMLDEAHALNKEQFHDWRNDSAPHSPLREMAGRPQKRLATLFDPDPKG